MKFTQTQKNVEVKRIEVQNVNHLELTDDELKWLVFICGKITGGGKIRDFTDQIWKLSDRFDYKEIDELFDVNSEIRIIRK